MNIKNIAVLDENNVVTNILVIDADSFVKEVNHIEYANEDLVIIGGDYFNGKFYPPKPYPSWVRDEENSEWKAPYDIHKNNFDDIIWDEDKKEWVIIGEWSEENNTYTIKGWNSETQEWEISIIQRFDIDELNPVTEIIKDLPLIKD